MRERTEKVVAVDTDLKGLVVIEACRRARIPVTLVVAGLFTREAEFEPRGLPHCLAVSEDYCLENATSLVFPARTPAEECRARLPKMARCRVIYNGIADEFLDAPDPQPDKKRIGAVMRLAHVKNPQMLCRVATVLRDRGIETDLVSGPAPRDMQQHVSRVNLIAPTHRDSELAAFYGSHRAVFCPSHFEVSGNVPMEAIASGTPAVVTKRMGISELFPELGMAHMVIAAGDVDGAVDCLTQSEPVPRAVRDHLGARFRWPGACAEILSAE